MHYLAYGSNLHPLRLLERVPSSCLLGNLELQGYRLAFHKRGQDGSGKCNLVATGDEADVVHAALYRMHREEKALLDAYEGAGYYVDEWSIEWQGLSLPAFIYLAEAEYIDDALTPYHWYREIVSLGARHLELPGPYRDSIESQEAVEDPDPSRSHRNLELIQRIRCWGS